VTTLLTGAADFLWSCLYRKLLELKNVEMYVDNQFIRSKTKIFHSARNLISFILLEPPTRVDLVYRLPDIRKVGELLGWSPLVDKETGLKKTNEYFRATT
jgi:hypothetical protein